MLQNSEKGESWQQKATKPKENEINLKVRNEKKAIKISY